MFPSVSNPSPRGAYRAAGTPVWAHARREDQDRVNDCHARARPGSVEPTRQHCSRPCATGRTGAGHFRPGWTPSLRDGRALCLQVHATCRRARADDRGRLQGHGLCACWRRQGDCPGGRHVIVRRGAAHRGCDRARSLPHEPGARRGLRQPHCAGRSRDNQSRHLRGGGAERLLLCARPFQSAGLLTRRQHRVQLGRSALFEVWRNNEQCPWAQACTRRRGGRGDRWWLARAARL